MRSFITTLKILWTILVWCACAFLPLTSLFLCAPWQSVLISIAAFLFWNIPATLIAQRFDPDRLIFYLAMPAGVVFHCCLWTLIINLIRLALRTP